MIFTLFYFIFHRIRCEILCECLSELQVKVSACNSFVMTFSICYNVSRSDGLVNFFFFLDHVLKCMVVCCRITSSCVLSMFSGRGAEKEGRAGTDHGREQ